MKSNAKCRMLNDEWKNGERAFFAFAVFYTA